MSASENDKQPIRGGRRQAAAVPILNAPRIVTALATFIVFSHLIYLLLPDAGKAWVSWYGALSPRRFLTGISNPSAAIGAAATLFTHMFLHANWLHVLMNTLWLVAFGAPVARRLGGPEGREDVAPSILFLAFFFVCGGGGALAYVALHPSEMTFLIGASGGVSGLLGGLLRFAFRPPGAGGASLAGVFDRNILVWTFVFVVMNLLVGAFGDDLTGGASSIAWESHIGGYLCGLLSFPLFDRRARTA